MVLASLVILHIRRLLILGTWNVNLRENLLQYIFLENMLVIFLQLVKTGQAILLAERLLTLPHIPV